MSTTCLTTSVKLECLQVSFVDILFYAFLGSNTRRSSPVLAIYMYVKTLMRDKLKGGTWVVSGARTVVKELRLRVKYTRMRMSDYTVYSQLQQRPQLEQRQWRISSD